MAPRHFILATLLILAASTACAANLTCPTSTTLEQLAACIRTQMPGSGSNGYVPPTAAEQADFRTVARQMLQGTCTATLPSSLTGIMERRAFTDSGNGKTYCLLMEVLDANNNGVVDRGWGTFITDAAAQRELSHQAPHPIADSTTEVQAVGIFKSTNSRSYLLAGAHRNANGSSDSTCQSGYGSADPAHNTDNMFHATNAELLAYYGSGNWYAIQWHGMAADTCGAAEVYMSHGRNIVPLSTDKIAELKNNTLAYHPTWDVETPGTGACTLNATDNTQGRLINGVPAADVCGTAATSYTGRFIHIEQDPNFRAPADWTAAVSDTFPAGGVPTVPAPPAALTATGGKRKVTLTWTASSGATSYNVKRSSTSGGPYSTIAANVTATSYVNGNLLAGQTFFYVVTAVNAAGESGNSPQAVGTAK